MNGYLIGGQSLLKGTWYTWSPKTVIFCGSQSRKMQPGGRAEKVSFSISTLPPGDAFELWLHFSYLWTIGQKSIIQIFLYVEY